MVLGLGMPGDTSAAEPAGRALEPPVLLPDGKEFLTWEVPATHTKDYFVDQGHPKADDSNPGTEALPFRTLRTAAEAVQPGERVLVKEGVYREPLTPVRGGTGPDRMVTFEAYAGHRVMVKGSVVLETGGWRPSKPPASSEAAQGIWETDLPRQTAWGPSPFALFNIRREPCAPFGFTSKRFTLRRGLVFQDGRRLEQVHNYDELKAEAGRYWVEERDQPQAGSPAAPSLVLHIRGFEEKDPRHTVIEATQLEQILLPKTPHLSYVRIKGFVFEHAGDRFPRPQAAAVSTRQGHHWIIEENCIRWANALGLDIGNPSGSLKPMKDKAAIVGFHLVRRNVIEHCGVGGLGGSHGSWQGRSVLKQCLIEDNLFRSNGWQNCEVLLECAAIKLHYSQDCVLRRNVILDCQTCAGIWLDYPEGNSRVTQNLILNTGTIRAGIYMEGSHEPDMVDQNVIVGCRIMRDPEAYPREYGGIGILSDHSDRLVVAHNLVAACQGGGLKLGFGDPKRKVRGRLPTANGLCVQGNIVLDCAQALLLANRDSVCDYNAYGCLRDTEAWELEVSPKRCVWADWPSHSGYDSHGRLSACRVSLARDALELRIAEFPVELRVPRVPVITHDFAGRERTGSDAMVGPLETRAGDTWQASDPRPPAARSTSRPAPEGGQ